MKTVVRDQATTPSPDRRPSLRRNPSSKSKDGRPSLSQHGKGFALLTVIWVLMVLMVLAFSFSFMARTDTLSSLVFRQGTEKRFWAEAGVERAVLELFYRKAHLNASLPEEQAPWRADGTPYRGRVGEGNFIVTITDESGKLDINTAPEGMLRALITTLVGEEIDGEALVDCILDWRDKDDLHRLKGAESDYYQSLAHPYKAKNGDFETLEELLLVKGMSRELLYGSKNRKGLMELLTVHNRTNRINLNSAPVEILRIIPGMTSEAVEEILVSRQKEEIKNLQEIGGAFNQIRAQILPFVTVTPGGVFTLEAVGFKDDIQAGYGIRTIVALTTDNRYKVLYYKTPMAVKHEAFQSGTNGD